MNVAFYLSVALLISAIVGARIGGGSNRRKLGFLIAASLGAILLIGYVAADNFTGHGIDAAVIYHLRYGLQGAGFGEYRSLIVGCATALGLVLTAIGLALFFKGDRRRKAGWTAMAWGLLAGSLATNPASWNLVEQLKPLPLESADFRRHYRAPIAVPADDEHPNFIFIFAESLERTYFDETIFPGLITDLRILEGEGTSFTNIHTLDGTGSTIGGMVASLCGIPLYSPAHINSMAGMDSFLPGAVGVSDVLHEQGYYLAFMGGASLEFAGKGKFLKSHHFDEVSGFSELHGRVSDKSYINNWGLYDDTLLEMAISRAGELAQKSRPFGLYVLTLDTHHPHGHVSRSAAINRYGDGRNPMLNAVTASEKMISAFVRRIQKSSFGANTVVVIASDHLAMNNAASDLLQRGTRRNLFLVLDPRTPQPKFVDRPGSTLDTGTTLFSFLGYKGHVGLGRDLLDPSTSDEELRYIHKQGTLASWRGDLIKFWQFPKFSQSLVFQEDPAQVTIDGRRFSLPVLIELKDEHETRLRFEYDAPEQPRLTKQVGQLSSGTPYLLIAARDDVAESHADLGAVSTPWIMVIGQAGSGETLGPLTNGTILSRDQVDRTLVELSKASSANSRP